MEFRFAFSFLKREQFNLDCRTIQVSCISYFKDWAMKSNGGHRSHNCRSVIESVAYARQLKVARVYLPGRGIRRYFFRGTSIFGRFDIGCMDADRRGQRLKFTCLPRFRKCNCFSLFSNLTHYGFVTSFLRILLLTYRPTFSLPTLHLRA